MVELDRAFCLGSLLTYTQFISNATESVRVFHSALYEMNNRK